MHFVSPRARTAFAIPVRAPRGAVREWVRPHARTGEVHVWGPTLITKLVGTCGALRARARAPLPTVHVFTGRTAAWAWPRL